ncbi:hypothetical protein PoB_006780100 [Plakobranchus ocellatus]|uniref:Uncharacterized protein n=1 Tax=Plakobranchus ocellatus TaxID=259542 RepID=A0AAV4DBI9_9GAST|nr:hypothetical protein PoB_006780100 [Plakobranchus ocellatus]
MRQGGDDDLSLCNGCKGCFKSKQIYRNKKQCSELTGTSVGSGKFVHYLVNAADLDVTETFKKSILDCFRHDEAGAICREDKVVVMLGQKLWARSAKKENMS